MIAVPFGFIGAMVGLILSGNPFSIATLYGFVAMAGIVVDNAIVLVAFINDARAEGMENHESIVRAGVLRLRPIFLTRSRRLPAFCRSPWACSENPKSGDLWPIPSAGTGGFHSPGAFRSTRRVRICGG